MEAKGVVAASAPQWILVTERLPEDRQKIIVFTKFGNILLSEYRPDRVIPFMIYTPTFGEVTYWMPLPAPPKAGD